jgi:sugar lactone lactonase YvrE
LNEPYEVRFDSRGNMFFVEMMNHVVRRVDATTGIITTIAGTGQPGYGGDGGPATQAQMSRPHSIALDGKGGLYIADIGNHRIRRVELATGMIDSIAGNGEKQLPKDGQVARDAPILGPRALLIRNSTLWIALREGHSIWTLDLATGTLQHIAGTGRQGYSGDGGAARGATFDGPKGIAVDAEGVIFIADTENQAIRRIAKDGMIETIAGGGPEARGYGGDGAQATAARLNRPHGICVDNQGVVYIGDTLNHRVRAIYWP